VRINEDISFKEMNIYMNTVFLSHSSKDKDFVEKLANDLNKQGVGVWFDKWEIKVGDSIVEKINDGLSKNDYLAIILSPNSVNSNWVKKELNSSLMKQLSKKSVKVLPILYKDCEIPDIIIDLKYADFRHVYGEGMDSLIEVLNPKSKHNLILEKKIINKKINVKEISDILNNEIDKAELFEKTVELMFYELLIKIYPNVFKGKDGKVNLQTDINYLGNREDLTALINKDIDDYLTIYRPNRFKDIIDNIDDKYKILIEKVLLNYRVHLKELISHTAYTAQDYIKNNILKFPKSKYFPLILFSERYNESIDEMNFYSYYEGGMFEVLRYIASLAGKEVYNIITENFALNFDSRLFEVLKKFLINHYANYKLRQNKKDLNIYFNKEFDVSKFLLFHLQKKIDNWKDVEDIVNGTFDPKKYYYEYKKDRSDFIY
jgi:hypothetical protein